MANNAIDFITTSEACRLLQVSKTIIKCMADQGELETWKTPGGHRRIRRESVLKLVKSLHENQTNPTQDQSNTEPQPLKTLVIDHNEMVHNTFVSLAESIHFPTKVTATTNGFEGLINAGKHIFDIIFIDLQIPFMDGYKAVNAIRETLHENVSTIIVMTSCLPNQIDRNQLPADVVLLSKPLNHDIVKQFMLYESSIKAK